MALPAFRSIEPPLAVLPLGLVSMPRARRMAVLVKSMVVPACRRISPAEFPEVSIVPLTRIDSVAVRRMVPPRWLLSERALSAPRTSICRARTIRTAFPTSNVPWNTTLRAPKSSSHPAGALPPEMVQVCAVGPQGAKRMGFCSGVRLQTVACTAVGMLDSTQAKRSARKRADGTMK